MRGAGLEDVVMITNTPKSPKFSGTDNPRYLRIMMAMLKRPLPREAVDSIAGAANGPDAVSQIRGLFPEGTRNEYIDCTRIDFIDRDGRPCRPGVYSFTSKARRLIIQWFASLRQGVNHG